MTTKSEVALKLATRPIIGLGAVLLVLVAVPITWVITGDASEVPGVPSGASDDVVARVDGAEEQDDTDGEQDSLASDARGEPTVEVRTLFSTCGDVSDSINLSRECREALDSYFLTDEMHNSDPARNYLPPEDHVTRSRIHSRVAEKLDEVLVALGREECNPPGDDIRFDLREACTADSFLDVGTIAGACGNFTAEAARTKIQGYSEELDELMDDPVVSVEDFRILSNQIREDMLYAAWMANRCATYPDIAGAMSEVFPRSERESYWESCVEELRSARGVYGSGVCPDDVTDLGTDSLSEAVARLNRAYRIRTVSPLYSYARRFGSRAAWFTQLSLLDDRPEGISESCGAVPDSRSRQ